MKSPCQDSLLAAELLRALSPEHWRNSQMETCSITFPAESNLGDIVTHPLDSWPQSSSKSQTAAAFVAPALSPSFRAGCPAAAALLGSAGNSNSFPFLNPGTKDPWVSYASPNYQRTRPFSALFLCINYLKYPTEVYQIKRIFLIKFTTGHPAAEWLNSCQGGSTPGFTDTKKRYMNITRSST